MTSFSEQQYRYFIKAFALVLLALAALWAATDLVLLAIRPNAAPVAQEFEMVDGLGLTARRSYQGVHFTTDENGFRRARTPPATPGEKRILVLGDSVTFGLGLANGEDWPIQLERYLRDHGVRATVMNAAVIGKMTEYMRTALDYYVSRQKPDLVIVQNTGNILAMSASQMHMARHFSASPADFLKAQFPSLASGSAVPALQCQSALGKESQNIKVVPVPRAIKVASEHSPLAAHVVSWIQKAHEGFAPAPARPFDPCRQYLRSEFAHMGNLIESARAKGVPLVLLKPTYTFNWGPQWLTDHFDKSKNLPETLAKDPEVLRRLVGALDFSYTQLAAATGTTLINPIASYLEHHAAPDDVLQYYSGDYTHYSAAGGRAVAEGIGAALLKAKLVEATETSPWKHPKESTQVDLQHRPFGEEARYANILLVCGVLALLAGAVGGSLFLGTDNQPAQALLLAPGLGLYLMLCVVSFAPEVSAAAVRHPSYTWIAAVVGLAGVTVLLIKNRRRLLQFLQPVGFVFAVSALVAAFLLAAASHRQTPHERRLETIAAWVEYGAMRGMRPRGEELQARMVSDGISRPYALPGVIESNASLLAPTSPGIPLALSRWLGIAPHDALLGTVAVGIAALACALAYFLRRVLPQTWPGSALLAAVTTIFGVCAVFLVPSFLGLFHLLGLSMFWLAATRMPRHPSIALGIAFLGGISLLFMPAVLALTLLLAACIPIAVCHWRGREAVRIKAGGLLVLIGVALAARVLFIDRPLGQVELGLIHGPLGLPLYFW